MPFGLSGGTRYRTVENLVIRAIFNADDFGRSHQENIAIRRAMSQGIVRSTTVMANLPAAEEIGQVVNQVCNISVGVHLNLTEGRPLLEPGLIPTLVSRDGTFHSKKRLACMSCLGLIRRQEITAELLAQIRRVRAWVGSITHVDSHQNVIPLPVVLPALIDILATEGIQRFRTESEYAFPKTGMGAAADAYTGAALRNLLRAGWSGLKELRAKSIQGRGYRSADLLLLGAPGYGKQLLSVEQVLSDWEQALPSLPNALFEVPLHPGFSPTEEQTFADPRMKHLLERFGVQVLSYADV